MKFRTASKLQSYVCQITKTHQCKVKARLDVIAIWFKQLCSTKSAQENALPGPQTYPDLLALSHLFIPRHCKVTPGKIHP